MVTNLRLIPLALGSAAAWLAAAVGAPGPNAVPSLSPPIMVVEPAVIPLAAPEVVNPMRGLYKWRGTERSPLPRPAFDTYDRFDWRDLEPVKTAYDFSKIERFLTTARAEGRRGSFRVRCLVRGNLCPDYISAALPQGWWSQREAKGKPPEIKGGTYVPDWNDPFFLERVDQLLAALGARYDGDPRITLIDIGMFGVFGEWHTSGFTYPGPPGAEPATPASMRRLIDAHVKAFPRTRLVMMSGAPVLDYALGLSDRMGWRRDSLGDRHFNDLQKSAGWALAKDRWKTAPVITEFMNPPILALARTQVVPYHVALIGNGNTARIEPLDTGQMADLSLMGKLTGYRFELRRVSLPGHVAPGGTLSLEAEWANAGATPAYEPWSVRYQLRDAQGRMAFEGRSELNLEKFLVDDTPLPLPGGPKTPPAAALDRPVVRPPASIVRVRDSWRLPVDLAAGTYALHVIVTLPGSYLPPMQLANQGQARDGSYPLAKLVVN